MMFLLKPPFIGDFPLPCLITRGYVSLAHLQERLGTNRDRFSKQYDLVDSQRSYMSSGQNPCWLFVDVHCVEFIPIATLQLG